jgi:hypothetical protein
MTVEPAGAPVALCPWPWLLPETSQRESERAAELGALS